jgi:hypothetical protein
VSGHWGVWVDGGREREKGWVERVTVQTYRVSSFNFEGMHLISDGFYSNLHVGYTITG